MEFSDFKERNVLIAENQEEYITLPAHVVGDAYGTTFVKLSFTEEELEYINRNGCIYFSVLTFGKKFGTKSDKSFPPMMAYAKNPFPYLQPLTDEISAIYFEDMELVTLYNENSDPVLQITSEQFDNKWIPSIGFKSFNFFRVERDMFGKVKIQITYDKKQGRTVNLNKQFYNREDL